MDDAARGGKRDLRQCRSYLQMLARLQLRSRLRETIDASDGLQETTLPALQRESFQQLRCRQDWTLRSQMHAFQGNVQQSRGHENHKSG
jgi:DNA-directed RNA polymerase specialized sigma24 family protein